MEVRNTVQEAVTKTIPKKKKYKKAKWLSEKALQIAKERRETGEISTTSDTTLMAESEEILKGLLMKGKGESERVGLKLNIQKTEITASGPITSWKIDGETMETVRDYFFFWLQNHCRW